MLRKVLGLLLVCLLLIPVVARGEDVSDDVSEMLALHNASRAAAGLPPLVLDEGLSQAAQGYAEYCARTGGTGHYADGSNPYARMCRFCRLAGWAENTVWVGPNVRASYNTWWNSGGHRANILTGLPHVGFGRAGNYWVACFGHVHGRVDSVESAPTSKTPVTSQTVSYEQVTYTERYRPVRTLVARLMFGRRR